MPEHVEDPTWHEQQCIHNYKVYKHLKRESPLYIDWEITLIFYSSCKFLDAQIIKSKKLKPSNHFERNRMAETEFPAINKEYRQLYDISKVSRYDRSVGSADKANALNWPHAIENAFTSHVDDHD